MDRRCPHCNKPTPNGTFICPACDNLLDIPPVEKETRMLMQTRGLESLNHDYFDKDSTLVLRLRSREKSFQLTMMQLQMGQILGRNARGHDPKAHIDLARYDGEELGVSRRHLHFRYDPQDKTVRITDMNSANGTFINGQKLHPGEVHVLRHGDRMRVGQLEIGVTILHATAVVDVG
ncbi:MAG: FHA domain-containing protein [Anaerolineae bacterium]|nr:FHA domain-containing protein [Anaerolineae bacterium]